MHTQIWQRARTRKIENKKQARTATTLPLLHQFQKKYRCTLSTPTTARRAERLQKALIIAEMKECSNSSSVHTPHTPLWRPREDRCLLLVESCLSPVQNVCTGYGCLPGRKARGRIPKLRDMRASALCLMRPRTNIVLRGEKRTVKPSLVHVQKVPLGTSVWNNCDVM